MKRKAFVVLTSLLLLAGAERAAQATTTIKIATLAPAGSSWAKQFIKMANDVSADTNGELQIDYQWNGAAGDEVVMVQKIRTWQLDAAAVSMLGLAQTGVNDVLLFELPGLFTSWQKLDEARDALKPELDRMFESKGFTVLGWGDVGAAKTMTVGFEVHHPSDLRGKGTFFFSGDPIQPRVYQAIGGITPRQMSFPELLPNLQSGAVNVIVAPPLVAEQLQWTSRVTHISTETLAFAIGATIASSQRMRALPEKYKEVLAARGRELTERLNGTIRRLDAQAFERMKATKVVYGPTDEDRREWRDVFIKVSTQLRGTVFTPALFDKVVKIADNPLVPKE
jgi:TRAP-type C4-dicarboxylate transport system substrate-binding protein